LDTKYDAYREEIKKIMRAEWFERIWTLQEVAVARECVLYHWDGPPIHWDELWHFVDFLEKMHAIPSPKPAAQSHIATRMEVQAAFKGNRKRISTTELLRLGRKLDASKLVDNVFALQHILECLDLEMTLPPPDYSKSPAQVFWETAKAIMTQEQSLDLLHEVPAWENYGHYGERDVTPPTWVPNWSFCQRMRNLQPNFNLFQASGESSPVFTFRDEDRALLVRGVRIDSVAERSEHCPIPRDRKHDREGDEETGVFFEWFSLAMKRRPYPTEEPMFEALMRTMLQNQLTPQDAAAIEAWFEIFIWGQNEANIDKKSATYPVPQGRDHEIWERYQECKKSGQPIQLDDYLAPLKKEYWFKAKSEAWAYSWHEWMKERQGYMWYESLKKGEPAFIRGEFAFRPFHQRICQSVADHQFFTTKKGYMGMVTGHVQKEDEIALLSGLNKPVVLRKPWRKAGSWELVGTAYVHGLMNGELWPQGEGLEELAIV